MRSKALIKTVKFEPHQRSRFSEGVQWVDSTAGQAGKCGVLLIETTLDGPLTDGFDPFASRC